jgi:hypothetical protein
VRRKVEAEFPPRLAAHSVTPVQLPTIFTIVPAMKPSFTDLKYIPDEELFRRLAETISWCSSLLKLQRIGACMRSRELSPPLLLGSREDMVAGVISTRHRRVNKALSTPVLTMPDLQGGRLLCYFPDAALGDGVAESESEGFFDAHNTPPWDTWVSFVQDGVEPKGAYDSYLLAYVPQQLVSNAADGILGNPELSIQWLDEAKVRLRTRLLGR